MGSRPRFVDLGRARVSGPPSLPLVEHLVIAGEVGRGPARRRQTRVRCVRAWRYAATCSGSSATSHESISARHSPSFGAGRPSVRPQRWHRRLQRSPDRPPMHTTPADELVDPRALQVVCPRGSARTAPLSTRSLLTLHRARKVGLAPSRAGSSGCAKAEAGFRTDQCPGVAGGASGPHGVSSSAQRGDCRAKTDGCSRYSFDGLNPSARQA